MSIVPYLPDGLPIPVPEKDGLSDPYWEGLKVEKLLIQRCSQCQRFQWGPEWICHHCLSFDLRWEQVIPRGRIFSWERVWHPVHPALQTACPYLVILVELEVGDNIRMVGNLLGDPHRSPEIGSIVAGVFEHHRDTNPPFSLLQWREQP
jgi:uncharacterized OB-fold protein